MVATASGARRRQHAAAHKERDQNQQANVELASPTSISMRNSFIIKNADSSFDQYYNMMRKRRNFNPTPTHFSEEPMAYGRVQYRRPAARDGHSGVMFGETLVVFGGDRHHMPFNDTFALDLRAEFVLKSHLFY